MNPEPDRVYFSEVGAPENWDDLVVESGTLNPVRLDPELWRPPLQFHPRTARDERREARREWRRLNRPFRRAFGGGELRRHILHQVGVSNAKRAGS